jgi:hypothetical protein
VVQVSQETEAQDSQSGRSGEAGERILASSFQEYSNAIYQMAAYQKHRNPEQWLASRTGRGTPNPQDSNSPGVKVEENANPHIIPTASLVYESGQSAGPGGRHLRAVNKGPVFGDEDDEEEPKYANRRREKELGGEGDADELDFEEDFADDDEKYPEDNQDEEAKELEVPSHDFRDFGSLTSRIQERIKKEYRKAKAVANDDLFGDSDDEDQQKLSGAGKQMQKMLKKNDKGGQYDDSDEDKNPYASSVCYRSSFRFFLGAYLYVNRRRRRRNPIRLKHTRGLRSRPHRLGQGPNSQLPRATAPTSRAVRERHQ